MKLPTDSRWLGQTLLMSGVVLLAGLVTYLAFVSPRVKEMRRLENACAQLRAQLHHQAQTGRGWEELERFLGREGLAGANGGTQEDGLAYLARAVQEAGLETLELTAGRSLRTVAAASSGEPSSSQLGLTVRGRFGRILEFVRALEQSPRLVAVDAFAVELIDEENILEAEFTVTVYNPGGLPR